MYNIFCQEYAVEQFTDKDNTKGEQATPAEKEGQEDNEDKEAVGAEVEYQNSKHIILL